MKRGPGGTSTTLQTSRVVNQQSVQFAAAIDGDVDQLKSLFIAGLVFPSDMSDESGKTALHVIHQFLELHLSLASAVHSSSSAY